MEQFVCNVLCLSHKDDNLQLRPNQGRGIQDVKFQESGESDKSFLLYEVLYVLLMKHILFLNSYA